MSTWYLRREPELVDPVDVRRGRRSRSGAAGRTRRDRDRDDALERAQRHELGGVGRDALLLEIDERQAVAAGERARDAFGAARIPRRGAPRRASRCRRGRARPRAGRAGRARWRATRSATRSRDRLEAGCVRRLAPPWPASRRDRRDWWTCEVGRRARSSAEFPRTRYRQNRARRLSTRARTGSPRRLSAKMPRYQSRIASPSEERDDRPEGEERRKRDRHLPRLRAVAHAPGPRPVRAPRGSRSSAPTVTDRPSIAPSRRASLTSPIPIPAGIDERRDEAGSRRRRARRAIHSGLGCDERLSDEHDRGRREHDPVRDDPVLEVDRRERDEDDAEERGDERVRREPEARGRSATTSSAVTSSTTG